MPRVKKDITTKFNLQKRGINVPKTGHLIWVQLYLLKKNTRFYYINMLNFDRETLTLAAIIVCIAASVYLYKEFTKSKNDIEHIKNFCNKLVTPPPQRRLTEIQSEDEDEDEEPVPVKKTAVEDEN
jgi:hypothetical protein